MIKAFNLKDKYAELFEELPNKSRIMNVVLSFFFENITEEEKESLILSSHNPQKIRVVLENLMSKNGIKPVETKPVETKTKETKPRKEKKVVVEESVVEESGDYSSWW